MTQVHGVVLAAGAGSRFGRPKALVHDAAGRPWVALAVDLLTGAGCRGVTVVLGAAADAALELVPAEARGVVASDWASGMGASLQVGLAAAAQADADAALITLVDLPTLPVSVAERLLAPGVTSETIRQAVFRGRPGHPVLVGRDHWPALVDELEGDRGARAYLVEHGVAEIECSDLDSGLDVDTP